MLCKIISILLIVGSAHGTTVATITTSAPASKTLADWNKAIGEADVCKSDEWGYLCNKDAWTGAADAVVGGKELQVAGLRRAMDHIAAGTSCGATDTECIAAKAIVDANTLQIPNVIDSKQLKQVSDASGVLHPAAGGMYWRTASVTEGVTTLHASDEIVLAAFATNFPIGSAITFEKLAGSEPTGLSMGKIYYVIAGATSTTGHFKVALTKGGAAVVLSANNFAAGQVTIHKLEKHVNAYYMHATLGIETNALEADKGSDYIDDIALIKWVDASLPNGCDRSPHSDVKSSAHVQVATGVAYCNQAHKDLLGRKVCLAAAGTAGTYTAPQSVSVSFGYVGATRKNGPTTHSQVGKKRVDTCGTAPNSCGGASTSGWGDVSNPGGKTFRLCMTSPSISDNKVFADTGLTVKARCGTSAENSYDANTEFALATGLLGASAADDGKYFRCQCKANYERSSTTGMCTQCGQSEDKTRTFTSVVGDGVLGFDAATKMPKASGACEMCMAGYTGTEYETTPNNFASQLADKTYSMTCAKGSLKKYKCALCPKGTFRAAVGGVHDEDCARCGAGKYVKEDAAAGATCEADVCVDECGKNTADQAVWGYTGAQTATVGTIADQMPRCVLKCPADKPNHDPQSKTCVALCPWPTVATDLADPNAADATATATIKVCQPMTCGADEYVKLPAEADMTYTTTGTVFKALTTKHALNTGTVYLPGVTCTAGDTAALTAADGTTNHLLTLVASAGTNGKGCGISHITFTASAAVNALAVGSTLTFTQTTLEADTKITAVVTGAATAGGTNSGALYTGFSYTLTAADFVPICTSCAGGETIAAGAFVFPKAEQSGNQMVVAASSKNGAWTTHTNTPTVNFAADAFKAYATVCTGVACTGDDEYVHDHTCHACPQGKYNRQVTPTNVFATKIQSLRNIADTSPADSICLPQTCANGEYLIPIDATAGATTGLVALGSGTGGVCAACASGKTNTFAESTTYVAANSNMKTSGVKATSIVDTLLAHTFKDGAMVQYTLSEALTTGTYVDLPSPFTGCTIAANANAAANLATTTSSTAGGTAVTMRLKAGATANVITQYQFIAGSKMHVGDEVRISKAVLDGDAALSNCPEDGFTYTIRASDFDNLVTGTGTTGTIVPSGSIFFARLVAGQTDEFKLEDSNGVIQNLITGSGKNAKFAHVAATTDLVGTGQPFVLGMNPAHANICRNILCTEHEFSDQDGTCTACPVGKTSYGASDDANAEHSDAVCVNTAVCSVNEKVVAGVCTACEAGATNAAGDLTEAVDTTCDPTNCGAQQVTSNACAPCAAGKQVATADNGALATGPDTSCVDIATCGVDQYTTGNTCTNCPAGLARPAGMSTTSTANEVATTVCTPWVCPVNHQLVNNECTPCQTGRQRWVTTGADTKTTSSGVVANELVFAAAHGLAAGTPVYYKTAAAEAEVPQLCNMKDNAKALMPECADAGLIDTCATADQAGSKGTAVKGVDQSDANECNIIYYVLAGTAATKMKLSRTPGGAAMTLTGGAAANVIQPVRGPTTKKLGPTSDEANNECEPKV